MRTLGGVWPQVVSFDNLLAAYRKARRGKSRSPAVVAFALELEHELLCLHRDLASGAYQPGGYRLFTLYERKPRHIAAAPFRDRVVHHALMRVVEPALDRSFIHDSYACRAGKGVHAAVDRYQCWARRYRYALKLDVSRYFPSVDHEILRGKLRRRVRDRRVLALFDRIIDTAPTGAAVALDYFPGDDLLTPLERRTGLPIGNLTSQFLANLYLDDLDHHVKESLGVRAYLRYVDDMVMLGDDKAWLADVREAVRERLASDRLRLHPRKAHVSPTRAGLDVLGYHVFPDRRRLRGENVRRAGRRLRGLARGYARGRVDWCEIDASVQSWIGHARHADTQGLRRKVLGSVVFRRDSPGASARRTGADAPPRADEP